MSFFKKNILIYEIASLYQLFRKLNLVYYPRKRKIGFFLFLSHLIMENDSKLISFEEYSTLKMFKIYGIPSDTSTFLINSYDQSLHFSKEIELFPYKFSYKTLNEIRRAKHGRLPPQNALFDSPISPEISWLMNKPSWTIIIDTHFRTIAKNTFLNMQMYTLIQANPFIFFIFIFKL